MGVITSVVPFLGIIILLVLVHELGHFITAKLAGVKVLEFGIGYPPRLFGVRRGETEYTINALPLGGFVRLLGEEDPSDPRSLAAKPRPTRLLVLSAGALMNLILPIFLFALSFMIPQEVSIGKAVITQVAPDSPAAKAGLQSGDVVLKINNRTINNIADLSYNVSLNQGSEMTMRVQRADPTTHQPEIKDLRVRARWAPPEGQGPTGISIGSQYPFTDTVSYPPWEAFPKGVQATLDSLVFIRNQVIVLTKGGSSAIKFSGPIGIAQATGEVVKAAGWKPLLELAALLSINLGIINILPLPMLDGGRVVFVLLEILRRGKRIAPEREALVHLIGFAAIITLVVVISYFDVMRIIRGESLFR